MTLKQRALVDVLKVMIAGMAVGTVIALSAQYIGTAITGITVAVILLAYFVKVAYDMRVSQLEFEQSRIERALKDTK